MIYFWYKKRGTISLKNAINQVTNIPVFLQISNDFTRHQSPTKNKILRLFAFSHFKIASFVGQWYSKMVENVLKIFWNFLKNFLKNFLFEKFTKNFVLEVLSVSFSFVGVKNRRWKTSVFFTSFLWKKVGWIGNILPSLLSFPFSVAKMKTQTHFSFTSRENFTGVCFEVLFLDFYENKNLYPFCC